MLPYLLNEYGLRDFTPREMRMERKIAWPECRAGDRCMFHPICMPAAHVLPWPLHCLRNLGK